jgi:hypothetical protein
MSLKMSAHDLADVTQKATKARRTTVACIRCRRGKLAVGILDEFVPKTY